ncbi:MAG: CsbD family protein [Alkalilacustris sp.]
MRRHEAGEAEDAVKEQAGKLTGHTSLEAEGKLGKAEGAVQKAYGGARDALRDV